MEGNTVKQENASSNSNNKLIKNYFKKFLSEFHMLTESSHGPFWSITFSNEEIEINVSGDIGFSVEINIGDSKFQLWQYDRRVNNAMKTNEENILYQLEILKRFLLEGQTSA